tara:strand:- start:9336 stop:11117 length:1782 start_codon:yes stop_codon:yes gene_type:complete
MQRYLFLFVFSVSFFYLTAQCTIDYNYFPTGANYGLDPDSLPVGYVSQLYDEDMTFYLPLDTTDASLSVVFEDFHITSISLPLGLTWECNNSMNNCHYDPAVNQYGCVKISGTPLIAGVYDVEVNLVATHNFSSISGTESISFILPLTILPDTSTSSNAGFAMTNSSGCLPVTVSFANNNPGMLSYFWDFGNGNTSILSQPVDQIYTQAGQYVIHYSAVQTNPVYFLESIEVVTGTCTDNILIGDVDLLYDIFTASSMVQSVGTSNAITQAFPLMINLANPLQLTGQDVTIDVWDDDGWPWGLEYCGGLTFTPQLQAGVFSSNGGGLSINYTVMEVPANTVTSTDTINVYDYPQIPNLVYDTLNNLIYTAADSLSMQWYYYNSPIPAATDTFIEPTSSGLYSLVFVNEYGCASTSLEIFVVICDTVYQPLLDDNGSTAWMLDSALYSNLQWYGADGMINGANHPFFPATESGFYYIVATDTFGCSYSSEEVFLSLPNSSELTTYSEFVKIGPNPFSNNYPLTIYFQNSKKSVCSLVLIDIYGKIVFRKVLQSTFSKYVFSTEEINKLSNGLYYLDILFDDKKIRKKVVKTAFN